MIHIRLAEFHIRRCESCMIRFFCRDMCVAENTLRGVRVEPAAVSGQLGRSVQKPSRKSGDAAFFGSFIAALFCAHDETCHECSYFVMPDRQLCLERGAFLRYHIYIVHGRRFPRRSKRKPYPYIKKQVLKGGEPVSFEAIASITKAEADAKAAVAQADARRRGERGQGRDRGRRRKGRP